MGFNKYPIQIVFFSNLLSILIYTTGIIILRELGWLYVGLYVAFLIILEIRLLRFHCPNCYYYGKVCAFGKGILSSKLFKKGNPEMFACKTFEFKDLIPDLLVFIIPFATGIILLILDFEWYILITVLLLIFLNFAGNAYIRGQIACKNCIQRELGCPAEVFFNPPK